MRWRSVDPGPPPADPKLSPSTLASQSGAPDRAGAAAARRRERDATALPTRKSRAEFARLAFSRHFYAAAARLWADAFAASPTLAADPITGNRFQAARAAALAGAEGGRLEDSPDARSGARMARAGRGLAGGRPRRVRRRPGIGDRPGSEPRSRSGWAGGRSTRPWRDSAMSRAWPGFPSPSAVRSATSGAGSMRCGRRPPLPSRRRTAPSRNP